MRLVLGNFIGFSFPFEEHGRELCHPVVIYDGDNLSLGTAKLSAEVVLSNEALKRAMNIFNVLDADGYLDKLEAMFAEDTCHGSLL